MFLPRSKPSIPNQRDEPSTSNKRNAELFNQLNMSGQVYVIEESVTSDVPAMQPVEQPSLSSSSEVGKRRQQSTEDIGAINNDTITIF